MNMKPNKKKYFVGLDIGTSKICALIAENINNVQNALGNFEKKAHMI